jgi:hypothetical protein
MRGSLLLRMLAVLRFTRDQVGLSLPPFRFQAYGHHREIRRKQRIVVIRIRKDRLRGELLPLLRDLENARRAESLSHSRNRDPDCVPTVISKDSLSTVKVGANVIFPLCYARRRKVGGPLVRHEVGAQTGDAASSFSGRFSRPGLREDGEQGSETSGAEAKKNEEDCRGGSTRRKEVEFGVAGEGKRAA